MFYFDSFTTDLTGPSLGSVEGVGDGQTQALPGTSCNSKARTLEECLAILGDPQVSCQSRREVLFCLVKDFGNHNYTSSSRGGPVCSQTKRWWPWWPLVTSSTISWKPSLSLQREELPSGGKCCHQNCLITQLWLFCPTRTTTIQRHCRHLNGPLNDLESYLWDNV